MYINSELNMYVNSHKNIQTLRFYFRMNMGFLSYLIITFILIGSNLYHNYFLNFAFDNRCLSILASTRQNQ